jgi:hypothetical protein
VVCPIKHRLHDKNRSVAPVVHWLTVRAAAASTVHCQPRRRACESAFPLLAALQAVACCSPSG